MAPKKAWEAQDKTVFVERDDGGREIISTVGGERKLFETARHEDESHEDVSSDDDD
jgi:hypothetical protein